MNNALLIKSQAFAAMQYFLNQYYQKTLTEDLGGICSCLMLLHDGKPADPAFEEDWLESAKVIIPTYHEDMLITVPQAYAITKEFLQLYCRIGFSQEVQQLLDRMAEDKSGYSVDIEIRKLWDESIELAIKNGPLYLHLIQ
jgi:hypothetical protein